jgi:hypothetical protein
LFSDLFGGYPPCIVYVYLTSFVVHVCNYLFIIFIIITIILNRIYFSYVPAKYLLFFNVISLDTLKYLKKNTLDSYKKNSSSVRQDEDFTNVNNQISSKNNGDWWTQFTGQYGSGKVSDLYFIKKNHVYNFILKSMHIIFLKIREIIFVG